LALYCAILGFDKILLKLLCAPPNHKEAPTLLTIVK
jgi:hypothetical protein